MTTCDTIIFFTARMTELADFYRFGLRLAEPQAHGRDHLGFSLDNGIYLGFDQVAGARGGSGGASVWFGIDDLQATFDRFVSVGAGVRYPPQLKPMGDILASLQDLDGNVFGLVQR